MSLIHNERTKLTAGALNTAATSAFTVGVFTPLAAVFYNLGGVGTAISVRTLVIGVALWLFAAVALHSPSRKAAPVNRYELLAFVITPLTVAALGWAVVLYYERYDRLRDC